MRKHGAVLVLILALANLTAAGWPPPLQVESSANGQNVEQVKETQSIEFKDPQELVKKPIERELKGGESHIYGLKLATGYFLQVVVEQKGNLMCNFKK